MFGPDILTRGPDLDNFTDDIRRDLGRVLDRLHAEIIVFPDHMEVRGILQFTVPLRPDWPAADWPQNQFGPMPPRRPPHAFHALEGSGEGEA